MREVLQGRIITALKLQRTERVKLLDCGPMDSSVHTVYTTVMCTLPAQRDHRSLVTWG